MSTSGTYRIRPAGRHILTIGRDLIQDVYAAVVELVKNAYDADSPDVNIKFEAAPDSSDYSIIISDHGHGMSRDTVINKWMVPSTRDKLDRRTSPAGRVMQGRKGVGRYAASILGTDLFLETVTAEGEKTTVYVEWENFEDAEYLDDVEILIETTEVSEPRGTQLTMAGDIELLADWDKKQFEKLRFELKKLKSPVSAALSDDDFCIILEVEGFPDVEDISETVESFPIFDLFDYKIAGKISADGNGTLTYSSQKVRNIANESITFDFGQPTGCGELDIDVRVYDRDKDAIDSLIGRGLKDESGNYVGKLQARQLLNASNGIGVYRNGFRIRPLGDPDFDWLKLNEQRVQNPSLRIGSNQAIGYVQIQSDEQSGLIEKSARDGLRENAAFSHLKEITTKVIAELETRRFEFRMKAGLSRSVIKVERELERLFSFQELKQDVMERLTRSGIDPKTSNKIIDIISREEEDKNKIAAEIRQAVAIYQGQATLGKIINVILHEGRRPLNYFRNQIPNLRYWYKSFRKTENLENLEKSLSIVEGIGMNAEFFVNLFNKLDPLAAGKRSKKEPLALKKEIENVLAVFEQEMKSQKVIAEVTGSDDFRFSSWRQDISAIFTNLVDNSLYWMNEKNTPKRKIIIELATNKNSLLQIDYHDTGPGIEPDHIASEVIFEPEFTTKPSGTGLGLAIAGEAAARNDLELKAFESQEGAWFRLQPKTEDEE
ncbi:MAG: sensor histidine kinase [Gemmatimonadetes bacterium]|nr:sensor histidine kinase [Gemmatimonadota bacterium]MYD62044.1 sensor histidine kinase [Gemmatimonadota bacterium]